MKARAEEYRSWILGISLFMLIVVFLISCHKSQEQIVKQATLPEEKLADEFADGNFPYRRLSTYGFFTGEIKDLQPSSRVIFYKPASSLFTDYALKSRFLLIPEGEKAQIEEDDLKLPKGSVLIKNFYYPFDYRKPEGDRRIIETRLMIHEEKGWQAYPYVWNESQTDAVLRVVGGEFEVRYIDTKGKDQVINYLIPNKNQCKSCHNKNEVMAPIGIQIKHLNYNLDPSENHSNQLDHLAQLGKLEGFNGADQHPKMVNYEDKSQALDDRAMAYLDINCSHCHSADGPASTSGLFLTYDQKDPMKLGINKTPVAAGSGAGSYKFDIVPGKPEESILIHRMNSTQVGVAMPELGRTTIDHQGLELIKAWISELR
ncbi:SO2930 family diheme c-type cytochrome [Algoriphagus sp.]|uniref:SO2930 family diheme c-type cytochrome n=1 Tax=Algoriphagus sp. TaxID=1872435 RepID=UPI00391B1AC7